MTSTTSPSQILAKPERHRYSWKWANRFTIGFAATTAVLSLHAPEHLAILGHTFAAAWVAGRNHISAFFVDDYSREPWIYLTCETMYLLHLALKALPVLCLPSMNDVEYAEREVYAVCYACSSKFAHCDCSHKNSCLHHSYETLALAAQRAKIDVGIDLYRIQEEAEAYFSHEPDDEFRIKRLMRFLRTKPLSLQNNTGELKHVDISKVVEEVAA